MFPLCALQRPCVSLQCSSALLCIPTILSECLFSALQYLERPLKASNKGPLPTSGMPPLYRSMPCHCDLQEVSGFLDKLTGHLRARDKSHMYPVLTSQGQGVVSLGRKPQLSHVQNSCSGGQVATISVAVNGACRLPPPPVAIVDYCIASQCHG